MDTTSNSVHNSHPKVNSITTDDLCKVYSETFEVRSKWQNVLLALGVGIHSIDSISKKWRDDPGDCYREGLSEWLNGGERSWEDIVHALSSPTVGSTAIASKIKKKYNRDIPKKGGDKQPLTIDRHSKQCRYSILLVIVIVVGLLIVILPPVIIHSPSGEISPSGEMGTTLNLYVNNSAIFPLSRLSVIFIDTFLLNTYSFLNIFVPRNFEIDREDIIVFHASDCQPEITHVNQQFSRHISPSNQPKHFGIATEYYLKESILSYNIFLPRTVNRTPSNDCLAILVIFDNLQFYEEFLTSGVRNGSQIEICINDYTTTETVAFSKNSYHFTGLYISTGILNNFTIDIVISGTVYQYNLHNIVRNSYGSCEIYYNIINECSITLPTDLKEEEKSEACVVAVQLRAGAVITVLSSINSLIVFVIISLSLIM